MKYHLFKSTLVTLLAGGFVLTGCNQSVQRVEPENSGNEQISSTQESKKSSLKKEISSAQNSSESMPKNTVDSFSVTPLETIYSDDFSKNPATNDWSNWAPDNQERFAKYDSQIGDTAEGSMQLLAVRRGVWQKKLKMKWQGGIYRLSASLKAKTPNQGDFGIGVRSIDEGYKFSSASQRFYTDNMGSLPSEDWHRKELYWIVPDSGELNGEKIGGYDLEFFARDITDDVWLDDLLVESIQIDKPYYEHFVEGLNGWERYIRQGGEGEGDIAHMQEGFADAGSVAVTLREGVPGISAAKVLPRKVFSGEERWALTAFAKAQDGSKPMLQVQQLDSTGKVLVQVAGQSLKGEGWGSLNVTFEIREETVEVRLALLNNGTDTAIFDNVLLRPAYVDETEEAGRMYPIHVGFYPADPIAAIDGSQPQITVSAGQTSAIGVFLWGEKRENPDTTIEIELPKWIKLLTAEYAVYGKEPLTWETLPGRDADHIRYRFKNPYPWMRAMQNEGPNNYSNLFLVFDTDASAGTKGELWVQSKLGTDDGEERRLPILVREMIEPVESTKDFSVGIWAFLWPNVLDDTAREKLLSTYKAAGMNLGQLRHDRADATLKTFQKLDLTPYVCIIPAPSMRDGYTGSGLLTNETAMRLADGKPYPSHAAIGLSLKDPTFRAAYKKRLTDLLYGFPEEGYAILDLEYWGQGGTKTACFHPSTIALFKEWARISEDEQLTPQLILDKYGSDWSKFRLWGYVEEHRLAREVLREIRPNITVITYDYVLDKGGKENAFVHTSPMSTLRVDPVVDGHLLSTYNREGIAFIDALEDTVPYLKRPVLVIPFLMKEMGLLKDKSYNYFQITAEEYQFEVVATAAYGGKGISGYPGQLLDADYLLALRKGVIDVNRYAEFYLKGQRADASVTLSEPASSIRYTVHHYEDKRLLTIFNGAGDSVSVKWSFENKENTAELAPFGYQQIEL